jgi:hypothetical protein
MKTLLPLLGLLVSASAFCSDVTVDKLTIVRKGGGQWEGVVTRDASGQLLVTTRSCQFRELPDDERSRTSFTLAGPEAVDAEAIFSGVAVLASDETPHSPFSMGGTWLSLVVDYSYEDHGLRVPEGARKTDHKEIRAPLVILESASGARVSDVLSEIEHHAREAARPVCH